VIYFVATKTEMPLSDLREKGGQK